MADFRCDFDSRNYDHADANGRPTLNSNPYINFSKVFWDGRAALEGGLEIVVSAGSSHERLVSSVVIEFPYEEFSDYWLCLKRLIPLFETLIRVWRPAWALVTSHAFRDRIEIDSKKKATIGWLNYFANPSVEAALSARIQCKNFETGGIIFCLTDDRLSAQNADQVTLAKEIQNSLDARGLLDKEHIFNYARPENAVRS